MSELIINEFKTCQQCGECCNTPCDLIPTDLPPLLDKFKMSLPEFFRKFLIALIIASPKYADEVLMMVPVRVDIKGRRDKKFLADKEYLDTHGKCVFLKNNKCSIHNIKPYGGLFLKCSKITGSIAIQLKKSQYFAYWVNNQHLFNLIFPGFQKIFDELNQIFRKKNNILETQGRATPKYDQLTKVQFDIIEEKLFPLFNNCGPVNGINILFED